MNNKHRNVLTVMGYIVIPTSWFWSHSNRNAYKLSFEQQIMYVNFEHTFFLCPLVILLCKT